MEQRAKGWGDGRPERGDARRLRGGGGVYGCPHSPFTLLCRLSTLQPLAENYLHCNHSPKISHKNFTNQNIRKVFYTKKAVALLCKKCYNKNNIVKNK